MKKYTAVLISIVLSCLLLSGCLNASGIRKLQTAIDNTSRVNSLSKRVDFEFNIDMQSSQLSSKQKKSLGPYSDIKGYVESKYDYEKNMLVLTGHVDLKNFSFDFEAYENEKTIILLLPMLSDYLKIDKSSLSDSNFTGILSIQRSIKRDFYDMLKNTPKENDELKKLGDTIISTPEGDIKAAEYEVQGDKARLKGIYDSIAKEITGDKLISRGIVKLIQGADSSKSGDTVYNGFTGDVERIVKNTEIDECSFRIMWDRDFEIRQEKGQYSLTCKLSDNQWINASYKFTTVIWDVNKKVDDRVQYIKDNRTFSFEEFIVDMPPFYKNILK